MLVLDSFCALILWSLLRFLFRLMVAFGDAHLSIKHVRKRVVVGWSGGISFVCACAGGLFAVHCARRRALPPFPSHISLFPSLFFFLSLSLSLPLSSFRMFCLSPFIRDIECVEYVASSLVCRICAVHNKHVP